MTEDGVRGRGEIGRGWATSVFGRSRKNERPTGKDNSGDLLGIFIQNFSGKLSTKMVALRFYLPPAIQAMLSVMVGAIETLFIFFTIYPTLQ